MATLNNLKPDYENARLTFDADSIDYIVYKQIQCFPKVLLGESESNEKLLKFCAKLIMRNCTNGCSECTFLEKDGGCPFCNGYVPQNWNLQ